MNAMTAIVNLRNNTGEKARNIADLYAAVEPLCKASTSDDTDATTNLYDWLYNGDYSGDETPESLAAEWDNLSK